MIEEEKEGQQGDSFDLYEHYSFIVDPGQSPLRIDKYLHNKIVNATRNKVQQSCNAGNVLVNGKAVKQNYKVKPEDSISVVMTFPPRDVEIIAEDIPLDVVYEDEDVIVINKNAGMVVHPAYANYSGTLLNALRYYFEKTGAKVENHFGYLVHRIDKDTSGLIIVAKNELAQSRLAKQFYDHSIERAYEALVWGDMEEEEGTIRGNLGRSPNDRRVMMVLPPDSDAGKHAVSHYKVLKRYGYVTYVECRLETGRTHQIRAHFKYLGHPLFNDERYGGDRILKGTTFTKYKQFVQNCFKIMPRQALHARTLGFIHPTTNKILNFESVLSDDFKSVLDKWDVYISARGTEES